LLISISKKTFLEQLEQKCKALDANISLCFNDIEALEKLINLLQLDYKGHFYCQQSLADIISVVSQEIDRIEEAANSMTAEREFLTSMAKIIKEDGNEDDIYEIDDVGKLALLLT